MAMWSNLSLIVPAIAMYFFAGLQLISQQIESKSIKELLLQLLVVACFGVLPFYGAIQIALSLKEADALYHGTGSGFYDVILNLFMQELVPGFSAASQYFFWPFFVIYLIAVSWITA